MESGGRHEQIDPHHPDRSCGHDRLRYREPHQPRDDADLAPGDGLGRYGQPILSAITGCHGVGSPRERNDRSTDGSAGRGIGHPAREDDVDGIARASVADLEGCRGAKDEKSRGRKEAQHERVSGKGWCPPAGAPRHPPRPTQDDGEPCPSCTRARQVCMIRHPIRHLRYAAGSPIIRNVEPRNAAP